MNNQNDYKRLLRELRDNDSLVVQWGIVFCVLLLFWGFIIDPFSQWKTAKIEMLQSQVDRQHKLESLKENGDAWIAAQSSYQEYFAKQSERFFQAAGPVVAQGELQGLVRGIAQKHGLQISNQASYDVSPADGIGQRLPISILVSGNTNSAMSFIAELSSYPKLLVVEQILLTRQNENQVNLTVNLSGFMLGAADE
jgi:Tfp pilus assembly protein PilO